MKIVKGICSFLSMVLLVVLLAIAVALVGPKLLGYDQFAVLSGSMEPNIHVGAIVYDKEVNPEELKEGDVITYKLASGTMVTHRIITVDKENRLFVTKGDANETEDAAPIPFDNVIGKYAFNIPMLGYISIYGKTPLGITAVCGVLVLLILLNFLPDALSGSKDEKKEEKVEAKIEEEIDYKEEKES